VLQRRMNYQHWGSFRSRAKLIFFKFAHTQEHLQLQYYLHRLRLDFGRSGGGVKCVFWELWRCAPPSAAVRPDLRANSFAWRTRSRSRFNSRN
jgi:hypothetical protein